MLFQNVKIREKRAKDKSHIWKLRWSATIIWLLMIGCATIFNACRAPKVDLRSLMPDSAIAYLETNDLGKALKSLTQNQAFRENARDAPDFSALEKIQMAIAVTGFDTSENQVTGENSILKFTARFVAVAETHAWQWQTVSLVENQVDGFVRSNYGADAVVEKASKNGGIYFTWSALDKRQIYAFVKNGRIYFGNDAAAIENCSTAPSSKNVALNGTITTVRRVAANSNDNLAFGYIDAEGIKKIADFVGVFVAVETTDETAAKSFMASMLPPILQNTTSEVVWTATQTERGIEDNYHFFLKPEIVAVTRETFRSGILPTDSVEFLPSDFFSATRYNLKNPLIAWRSLLLLTAQNIDVLSSQLLTSVSGALLEPYGITDPEKFLSSIETEILTIRFDESGEKSVVVTKVVNAENLKNSIARDISFQAPPTMHAGAAVWFSENKLTAATFVADKFIIGDSESVFKCLEAKQNGNNRTGNRNFQMFVESRAAAVTLATDVDSVNRIVEVLATPKDKNRQLATFYMVETRFSDSGIERKTISDFGLLGTVLEKLNQ